VTLVFDGEDVAVTAPMTVVAGMGTFPVVAS